MKAAFAICILSAGLAHAVERPLIFPEPRELRKLPSSFVVDESVAIVIPESPSAWDEALARLVVIDVGDRYHVPLRTERVAAVPAGRRVILAGSIANPLVRHYCEQRQITLTADKPGKEGYVLAISPDLVLVAGSDDAGAFYGLQSLRQILSAGLTLPGLEVRDWPRLPLRGIRLYLPGHENIPFFKRFLRDYMALYKYN